MRLTFLIVIFFAFSAVVRAGTVGETIPAQGAGILLGPIGVFEDVSGLLSIDTVLSRPGPLAEATFLPGDPIALQSPRADTVWWLRFSLRNTASRSVPLRLLLGPPGLKRVDAFIEKQDERLHLRAGAAVPMQEHSHASRLPSFSFRLDPGEQANVHIRVQSSRAIQLLPRLYHEEAYLAKEGISRLWDGLLFGGLLSLGWCVLLIALLSRRLAYLCLGLLCLGIMLYEASIRGYAKLYLWPDATDWGLRSTAVLGYGCLALFAFFLGSFAKSENIAMRGRGCFLLFAFTECVLASAAFMSDLHAVAVASAYASLFFSFCILMAALLMLKNAAPTARLVLLTAIFFLLHIGLRTIERLDQTPGFIRHLGIDDVSTGPVAAVFGLGITLIVLAAWINHLRLQRKAARDDLALWQEQDQQRLRDEVARQTHALNQALQYADAKNRQKSEMLGYISHDLRAPLATIVGYARRLGRTLPPEQSTYVQAIERSANYQLTLIDDLLEYAKGEIQPLQLAPAPVEFSALMEDIAQYAHALSAQQSNVFILHAETPLPTHISIDSRRLQQVLLNLLSNAAKFTRQGSIRLSVGAHRLERSWRLHFDVADSGIGIASRDQPHIFKVFTQLGVEQGGVGLGLFIAQRIVEGMGGALQLSSKPGVGSRFSFAIEAPCLDDAVLPGGAVSAKASSPPGHLPFPAGTPYPIPPAHARMDLAGFARDGHLTDIEEWLHHMSGSEPSYPDFLAEMHAALQVLDLERVESLALLPDSPAAYRFAMAAEGIARPSPDAAATNHPPTESLSPAT